MIHSKHSSASQGPYKPPNSIQSVDQDKDEYDPLLLKTDTDRSHLDSISHKKVEEDTRWINPQARTVHRHPHHLRVGGNSGYGDYSQKLDTSSAPTNRRIFERKSAPTFTRSRPPGQPQKEGFHLGNKDYLLYQGVDFHQVEELESTNIRNENENENDNDNDNENESEYHAYQKIEGDHEAEKQDSAYISCAGTKRDLNETTSLQHTDQTENHHEKNPREKRVDEIKDKESSNIEYAIDTENEKKTKHHVKLKRIDRKKSNTMDLTSFIEMTLQTDGKLGQVRSNSNGAHKTRNELFERQSQAPTWVPPQLDDLDDFPMLPSNY